jgi:hypothetical protein
MLADHPRLPAAEEEHPAEQQLQLHQQQRGVDPEQLQLLEEKFDAADSNEDGGCPPACLLCP